MNPWLNTKSKSRRPLDSIVLQHGVIQTLLEDAKEFLSMEDWYIKAGIPYRRGYLLHGPPGTGKSTSLACPLIDFTNPILHKASTIYALVRLGSNNQTSVTVFIVHTGRRTWLRNLLALIGRFLVGLSIQYFLPHRQYSLASTTPSSNVQFQQYPSLLYSSWRISTVPSHPEKTTKSQKTFFSFPDIA